MLAKGGLNNQLQNENLSREILGKFFHKPLEFGSNGVRSPSCPCVESLKTISYKKVEKRLKCKYSFLRILKHAFDVSFKQYFLVKE